MSSFKWDANGFRFLFLRDLQEIKVKRIGYVMILSMLYDSRTQSKQANDDVESSEDTKFFQLKMLVYSVRHGLNDMDNRRSDKMPEKYPIKWLLLRVYTVQWMVVYLERCDWQVYISIGSTAKFNRIFRFSIVKWIKKRFGNSLCRYTALHKSHQTIHELKSKHDEKAESVDERRERYVLFECCIALVTSGYG